MANWFVDWTQNGGLRFFHFLQQSAPLRSTHGQRWLTPNVVLANHTGLSAMQVRQAQAVVSAHLKETQDAWNHHFGG